MYQQTTIVGYTGSDPEEKFTADGKPMAFFSVAVSKRLKGSAGESFDKTTWFRVMATGMLAETIVEHLKKGALVLVLGELNSDIDTGGPKVYQKRDGSWASSYELYAQSVRFLSKKEEHDEISY